MNWLTRSTGLAALLVSAACPLHSQARDSAVVVERVVAIVGKIPITQTMVDEKILTDFSPEERAKWSPEVTRKTRAAIVDTLVGQEALFQAALQDTMVKVTDQEIADNVDASIRELRANYSNPAQMNRELREIGYRDLDEYRARMIDQTRRQAYIGRYTGRLRENSTIKPLNPTEREVRAFYDAAVLSGNMTMIPPSITFRQIVVAPKPSAEAMARARKLVDSLIDELHKGADFATVARRFSMDPGSKDRGGDLQWHRSGSDEFVREFEDAAFRLKPGEISAPVETPFGLHIIQVSRVQGTEAHIFHILIIPEMDSTAMAAARAKAEEIRKAIVAGASMDSLHLLYQDPVEAKGTDGRFPIEKLLPAYAAVKTLEVGDVSPLIVLQPESMGESYAKYAIIKLTGKFPEGPVPYEEKRDDLRAELALRYGQDAYIKQLLSRTYVDIRLQ